MLHKNKSLTSFELVTLATLLVVATGSHLVGSHGLPQNGHPVPAEQPKQQIHQQSKQMPMIQASHALVNTQRPIPVQHIRGSHQDASRGAIVNRHDLSTKTGYNMGIEHNQNYNFPGPISGLDLPFPPILPYPPNFNGLQNPLAHNPSDWRDQPYLKAHPNFYEGNNNQAHQDERRTKKKKRATAEQKEMKNRLLELASKATDPLNEMPLLRLNPATGHYEPIKIDSKANVYKEQLHSALKALSAKKLSPEKMKKVFDYFNPEQETYRQHRYESPQNNHFADQSHSHDEPDYGFEHPQFMSEQNGPHSLPDSFPLSSFDPIEHSDSHQGDNFNKHYPDSDQGPQPTVAQAKNLAAEELGVTELNAIDLEPRHEPEPEQEPEPELEPGHEPEPEPEHQPEPRPASDFRAEAEAAEREVARREREADEEQRRAILEEIRFGLSDRLHRISDLLYFNTEFMNQLQGIDACRLTPIEREFRRLVLCNSGEQFCGQPEECAAGPYEWQDEQERLAQPEPEPVLQATTFGGFEETHSENSYRENEASESPNSRSYSKKSSNYVFSHSRQDSNLDDGFGPARQQRRKEHFVEQYARSSSRGPQAAAEAYSRALPQFGGSIGHQAAPASTYPAGVEAGTHASSSSTHQRYDDDNKATDKFNNYY